MIKTFDLATLAPLNSFNNAVQALAEQTAVALENHGRVVCGVKIDIGYVTFSDFKTVVAITLSGDSLVKAVIIDDLNQVSANGMVDLMTDVSGEQWDNRHVFGEMGIMSAEAHVREVLAIIANGLRPVGIFPAMGDV